MRDFIAFDTETTGTSPDRDEIIEIGAVRFVGGKPTESFASFARPRKPIPESATRVNGITNEMVKSAPSIDDALEQFTSFCGDTLLVAHNAAFDVKFISAVVKRLEVPAPRGEVLDTYPISKVVLPQLFNHRLQNLARHFQIADAGFHRAQADASYCGQVFVALLREMVKRGDQPFMKRLVEISNGTHRFPLFEKRAKQLDLLAG